MPKTHSPAVDCDHETVQLAGAASTWVMDLDGVVWLADRPIPGAADAIARLREASTRVLFVTNNAAPTIAELIEKLNRAGVPAQPEDLITSAQAAASMIAADSSALVCGEEGLREALRSRGIRIVEQAPADVVAVGWTRHFDFELLSTASAAVRNGAQLIGTNEDATYPTPDGLLPGAGSILAAVSTASQVEPEIAGKPHEPLVSLLKERCSDMALVVGDRPSTDGLLAKRLEVPFALVRSGVTKGGHEPIVVEPDHDAPDLRSLVEQILGS